MVVPRVGLNVELARLLALLLRQAEPVFPAPAPLPGLVAVPAG